MACRRPRIGCGKIGTMADPPYDAGGIGRAIKNAGRIVAAGIVREAISGDSPPGQECWETA
jgi:hypothetical protein